MRAAALAAALLAAVVLPAGPPGIGVPLVALLATVAVLAAARRTLDLILFGPLALALATMPALLDAPWVVALDLAAAWGLACAAAGGPVASALTAPLTRLRELPALAPPSSAGAFPAVRGVALGGLLVLPFGALFRSADPAFARVLDGVPLPELGTVPERTVIFTAVLLATLGLALAARASRTAHAPRERRRVGIWEWALPLAVLDALFLAFVSVQLAVLFGGHDHVLRTAGLTYAEYARSGFWQLLAAAGLTLVVAFAAATFARADGRRQRLLLTTLLALLCALTIVVLASALRRLDLYEDAFGLTRARLLADAIAVWLAVVLAVVAAAVAAVPVRRHAPRALVAVTGAGLLAFSLANPDRLVAAHNVERWHDSGRLDVGYLQGLSADAAPALASLPDGLRRRATRVLALRLAEREPWGSANLSRHHARTLLD